MKEAFEIKDETIFDRRAKEEYKGKKKGEYKFFTLKNDKTLYYICSGSYLRKLCLQDAERSAGCFGVDF